MPNVVTPFSRRRNTSAHRSGDQHPRHRRDGYFDEHDQWHDSTESSTSKDRGANA